MKNAILTAIVALGVAVPSLATAMEAETIHSDKAAKIFMQLADESRDDRS